ncbi:hypothetical protein [Paenimyroides aestuarii]|uniref:Lipoprotein n=1 Tax=Paenimyroides aestuarii TaxID=2968490 RepID=A0ABY5NQX3_9FLAO|nr:hypothetical protein [Paenimyroides aestuarii]UUV20962.1 hypothetical protein NPX36_11630 [Paenimyroides aestuarii]
MRISFCLFLLSISVFSCKKEESVITDMGIYSDRFFIDENAFFEQMSLDDTLTCYIMLDKCGEWGGPQEYYKIYQTHKDSTYLKYYWFDMDCDSNRIWRDSMRFHEKSPILLTQKDKKYLSNLFLLIMKGKITEKVGSNAGDNVHLFSKDSTLNVSFHTDNDLFERDYKQIKNQLFKN